MSDIKTDSVEEKIDLLDAKVTSQIEVSKLEIAINKNSCENIIQNSQIDGVKQEVKSVKQEMGKLSEEIKAFNKGINEKIEKIDQKVEDVFEITRDFIKKHDRDVIKMIGMLLPLLAGAIIAVYVINYNSSKEAASMIIEAQKKEINVLIKQNK